MTLSVFFAVSLFACVYVFSYGAYPGPSYAPTKGSVWPKPQYQAQSDDISPVDVGSFQFLLSSTSNNCSILLKAISRYEDLLHKMRGSAEESVRIPLNSLSQAIVTMSSPCTNDEMPYLGMDERYTLIVADEIKMESLSIWGTMRAMETMVQLIYTKKQGINVFYINHTTITDWPAYTHRGLLIDTSRHFISVSNIMKTLEAMEMNKMNVLHWHITDDQSFPYQSKVYPELSAKGAYHESMVYNKDNIREITEFARDRGIRVIPEIDVPGHTRSWGEAYPEILTECYKNNKTNSLGPMNPIRARTYSLLRKLFEEVQQWFPDKYFHIGGDEVQMGCWASNPELLQFMKNTSMKSVSEFQSLFIKRAIQLLNKDRVPIVWQDVFEMNVPLKKETLVQVWKYGPISAMEEILESGHRVLFSSDWYLDYYLDDFTRFYAVDPRSLIKNQTLAEGVVGGEACMWGEKVDDRNIISRVWPRASAVAERLWSGVAPNEKWDYSWSQKREPNGKWKLTQVGDDIRRRLEEHTCGMIKRGINAEPASGPGFCVV